VGEGSGVDVGAVSSVSRIVTSWVWVPPIYRAYQEGCSAPEGLS